MNNPTIFALGMVGLGVALLPSGCCKEKPEKAKKDPTIIINMPPTSTVQVGQAPTLKPTALPQATTNEQNRPLNYIPDIPRTRSAPPTVSEWAHAQQINTQGANSHPRDCFMKIKREWLKVHCEGRIARVRMPENFGVEGSDYYKQYNFPKFADVIVRLKRGKALKLRIIRTKPPIASLFVNWPGGSSKPNIIALGKFFGDPDSPM